MTDSPELSDNQADDLFENKTGERLWRRGAEPPGVIDVRFGQQKYFRIVGWLARRTALVAHLRSRYGVAETQAHGEHPFAVQHPFGRQLNLFSTTVQSFSTIQSLSPATDSATPDAPQNQTGWNTRPSSLAAIIAERSLKPAAEQADSPERKFRISRRPPPMLLKSDRAPTTVTGGASFSPQSHTEAAAPRPSRDARVNEAPLNEAPLNEAPVTNQTQPDFVFRKSDAESPGVEKASEVTRTSAAASIVEPVLLSQSAGRARRSQSDDAAAQKGISNSQGSSVDNGAVVVDELRGDSFNAQRPDVIWRTSQATDFAAQKSGSTLSSAGGSNHNASAPTAQQSGQAGSTANVQTVGPERQSGEAQSKEVQVENISPQVMRAISERVLRALNLDLKLERERRGGTKWR